MPGSFPYPDIEKAFDRPLATLLHEVVGGAEPSPWGGPPLDKPVAHVALQPQEAIDTFAELTRDQRMTRVLRLAVQLGICQGYALAAQEFGDRDKMYKDILKAINAMKPKKPRRPKKPHGRKKP